MRDQPCERQGTCPVQRWKASNTAWYLHKLALQPLRARSMFLLHVMSWWV